MKAIWNNVVIAESNDTIVVEGNHYFPKSSLNNDLLLPSDHSSYCGWKGESNYFHIQVDGQTNENAAWYYAQPKEAANNIKGYIAFWSGVEVVE